MFSSNCESSASWVTPIFLALATAFVVFGALPSHAGAAEETTLGDGIHMAAEAAGPASGVLYFSQDNNDNGLFQIDPVTGVGVHVGFTDVAGSTVGLAPSDDPDALFGSQPFGLLRIATDGSGTTLAGSTGIEGMAFDTTTGRLFGAINGDFFELNPVTGAIITTLAAPGFDVEGLAADPARGRIYGIGDGNNLVFYNIGGNNWTTVGDTGMNWNDAGLAYDTVGETLYAMSDTQGANLYTIDQTTASVTLVGATGITGTADGGLAFISALPSSSAFIASAWQSSIHLLGPDMATTGGFAPREIRPNALAIEGTLVYVGFPFSQEVVAYDLAGVEQFSWTHPDLPNIQGMTVVDGELAITSASLINFHNPMTGAVTRSIPNQSSVEGMAYDGALLWLLGSDLYGVNPANGTVVSTVPNAATGCAYGGTGIAVRNPGELVLGCADGSWFLVNSGNGAVLDSGNNGVAMYGLVRSPPIRPPFFSSSWTGPGHMRHLDRDLEETARFEAGATAPNGIACGADLVFSGHFSSNEVVAYDFTGIEQFRWSATLSGLQGMAYVDDELAVCRGTSNSVDFFNPMTGALIRSQPFSTYDVEGIAYDGRLLWLLQTSVVYGIDPDTGTVITTLPNAASGCAYGGTAIAPVGAGSLVLGCSDGTWFKIRDSDGTVLDSGNNSIEMMGLTTSAEYIFRDGFETGDTSWW